MPWASGAEFASRHNKRLKGPAADKAKDQAEAMMREGVPEGTAIATANKTGNRMMRYDHPRSRKAAK
jgi:uncharacterized protein YdaT